MKKIFLHLILFIVLISSVSAICENFNPADFNSGVTDSTMIDCAILNGIDITSQQFNLASATYKYKHVLSQRADFLDENQRKTFQSLILGMNFNVVENEQQVASYFAWLHDNLNEEIVWEYQDTIAFERVISVDINLINLPTQELIRNYASYIGPENLFIFYANTTKNVTFARVDGKFKSFDNEHKIFTTDGPKSRNLSLDTTAALQSIGFSDFIVYSDGSVGALKYKNNNICEDCTTVVTPEGIYIEGNNVKLNNGYVLNSGSMMVHTDSHVMIYKDSIMTDMHGVTYTATENLDLYYMNNCPKNNKNSCIEIYQDDSIGYLGVDARKDASLKITDRNGEIQAIEVRNIKDGSEVLIEDGEGNKALVQDGEFMVRGNPNFIIGHGDESCSGFWGSVSETCEFGILEVGDTVVNRALGIIERHDEFIDKFGVGTHYGSESGFGGTIRSYGLTPQQAWVAHALQKGKIKDLSTFDASAKKVKKLTSQGFDNNQLLNYYFFRIDGLSDAEAIQKAKTTNLDSRLLDEAPDLRLTQTDCVTFVDEVIQLSFSDWKKADVYKELKKKSINSDPGKKFSVYWVVHHLKEDRNWQTIFLSPWGSDQKRMLKEKNGVTTYWQKGLTIDYVANDYLNKDNPAFDALENNMNLRAGIVSLGDANTKGHEVGYHATLLIRDPKDNKLKIVEQHWSAGPTSKRNFEITPLDEFSYGHILIAVIPGSLG